MMAKYRFDKSRQLFEEAKRYLAGGVSSHFRSLAIPHPMFFSKTKGVRIWDVDGNEYLDFTLSQGPLLLGHSHPEVLARVEKEQSNGQLYAGQSRLELELARKLVELVPGADRVRFSGSGSEAVHTAIRLARAITGKKKIIKFEGHYHGWYDNIFVDVLAPAEQGQETNQLQSRPRSGGQLSSVLNEIVVLPWNDLDIVERTLEKDTDIATLITEPVMCNTGCILPLPGYLQGLRKLCDHFKVILIFDEVITGFRVAPGGAQEYFGIVPDLSTFGKAMASGFPISALAGKAEYMEYVADGRVIHAGTLNANVPSVAAALATLEILAKNQGEVYDHITRVGQLLMEGLRDCARHHNLRLTVQGIGPMFHTSFASVDAFSNSREYLLYHDPEMLRKMVFELLQRGVLVIPRGLWYMSALHTEEEIRTTLNVVDETFAQMKNLVGNESSPASG